MNISIIGWYGMNNVGDEAFRVVLPQFFSGHNLEFITPPKTCNNPDIVVLGGGAVASPFYLDTMPDCPRFAIGVDMAYKSEIDLLSKYNFKRIIVRNKSDLEELKKKVNCPVDSMPDLAFLIRPTGNRDVFERYRRTKKPCVGVFVTDYVNPAIDRPIEKHANRSWQFQTKMAAELDKIQESGYEVMLVPCSTGGYGDDRRINLGIASFMKTKPSNIMDTISPQDMIDLTSCMFATVCMRFHAHVFSIIAGVKFLSLDLTRKVEMLLKENNLSNISVGRFDNDDFIVDDLSKRINDEMSIDCLNEIANHNYNDLQSLITRVRQEWLL